jgi:subtilase family serine protease
MKKVVYVVFVVLVGVVSMVWAAQAGQTTASSDSSQAVPLITGNISDSHLVTLAGNTRPEATAKNDRGRVADSFRLDHMILQLRRSPEQEQALERYIDQLHDPASPNFHQWLTAEQLGEKYGLAQSDLDKITGWLKSHGFVVNGIPPSRMSIDFSGIAGQVRGAFHTEIHKLQVDGVDHIANMSDPRIPAALAPAVAGVVSLHDFRPHPMYRWQADYTFTGCSGNCYVLAPADLATIYNLNPLFAKGYSGQGQTIVVIEDTDLYTTQDWDNFRSTFGLSTAYPSGSFTQIHPTSSTNSCTDPGYNGDDIEATLDAEWASAAAPSAAIELASCESTQTNWGGFIALQNLLNASSPPAIVSISYGAAETEDGATFNAAISAMYQQAAGLGVSVFVSAGDADADVVDQDCTSPCAATHGINVNGWATTQYNVAVGGTDFGDTYAGTNSTYWSTTNTSTYGSALSYIPEIPWNDSCASLLIAKYEGFTTTYGSSGFCNSTPGANFLNVAGGSGGPSGCATGAPTTSGVVSGSCAGYPKPTWQSVFGNPADGVRDIPDVSLFAANGVWGHSYVFCFTDTSNGGTTSCAGAPDTWSFAGGTSFAAPIMAAIQSLVNQYTGKSWGNPNPTYYSLAATEYGTSGSSACNSTNGNTVSSSCIFYDVTEGDNDAPCTGTNNCYLPSGKYGVLSTSNSSYQPAYATQTGWDFATGIGTVNAYNLVTNFVVTKAATTTTVSVSPNSVAVGTSSPVTLTAAVKPSSGSGTPTGTVTFYNGTTQIGTGTLSSGTASLPYTVSSLAVGSYPITAVYGGDSTYAGSTSTAATLSVTLPQTTTTVTVSPTPAKPGTTVSITATVAPQSGSGTPTGTVTFYNGTTQIGTGTLSSGTATLSYNTSALNYGSYSITATYGGDSSFAGSTSAAVTLNIEYFSLSASPTTVTITAPGQSGSTTITVTPDGPLSASSLAFSCSGLPSQSNCTFGSVTNNAVTLTISTTAASDLRWPQLGRHKQLFYALLLPGFLGVVSMSGRRRTWRGLRLLGLIVILALPALWLACSSSSSTPSSPGTPTGTSMVTVTATTSGTSPLTNTTTFTLNVQ